MTRINLLPWRESRRLEKNKEFYVAMGFCLLIAAGIGFGGYKYVEDKANFQAKRNARLNSEIALLAEELKAIAKLEETKSDLLSRMDIIQELQGKRPQIVHTFQEIATRIPDGIYLTSMKQTRENTLELMGLAESNARVSALMRRMDSSDYFTKPVLDSITSEKDSMISTFKLDLQQQVLNDDAEPDDGI